MPRTKLTEKYSKPKVPPPNYLSEMLKRYKKAKRINDAEIAARVKTSRNTVNAYINQPPEKWNIGDLKRYCDVLGAPIDEALKAVEMSL